MFTLELHCDPIPPSRRWGRGPGVSNYGWENFEKGQGSYITVKDKTEGEKIRSRISASACHWSSVRKLDIKWATRLFTRETKPGCKTLVVGIWRIS